MSTHSTIALEFQDGSISQIYCHYDGYLSGVGQTLLTHYSDFQKMSDLIALGDLSSLENTVFDSFYCRDRNEDYEDTKADVFKDIKHYESEADFEGYDYLFRNIEGKGTWFVNCQGLWKELTPEMIKSE